MRPYKKLLVGLDLSEADGHLIAYAGYLGQAFPAIEQIVFCHNIRLDLPEHITHDWEKLRDTLREELRESIEAAGDKLRPGLDTSIEVAYGKSTPQALKEVAQKHQIDLFVGAKKFDSEGSGLVLEKLMRTSGFTASMLLVPPTAFHRFDNILTAVDFSKRSAQAAQRARYWQQQTGAKLDFAHVLSMPSRYFPYIPLRDMEPELRQEAEKKWRAFTKKHLPELEGKTCAFVFHHGQGVARRLRNHAVSHRHDLLVIGAKGSSTITQMLLGSVALSVMNTNWHFPVLVVND